MSRVKIDDRDKNIISDIRENALESFRNSDSGTINVQEASEIAETLKELNNDNKDIDSKMSNIDMRTRLHYMEISGLLAIDTLVSFNFIPERCLVFTRQKKRLAVSLKGKGREEIVQIARGHIEDEIKKKGGIINGIKNFMGGNK